MTFSAALAFYVLLSMIPFLLLSFSALGLVADLFPDVFALNLDEFLIALGKQSAVEIQWVLDPLRSLAGKSGRATLGGLAVLVLPASQAFRSIELVMEHVLNLRPEALEGDEIVRARNVVVSRVIFIRTLLVFILGAIVMVAVPSLLSLAQTWLHGQNAVLLETRKQVSISKVLLNGHGFSSLLSHAIAYALGFAVIVRAASRRVFPWSKILLSAPVYALSVLGANAIFIFYLREFASMTALYGGLASVFSTILWIDAQCILFVWFCFFITPLHDATQSVREA